MFLILVTAVSLAAAIVLAVMVWRLTLAERRRSDARVATLAAAIDGATAPNAAAGTRSLFNQSPHVVAHGRPLLKVAIGFAAAVAVIVVIAMISGRRDGPGAAQSVSAPQESLELLSMRHTRAGETLLVTGLVRNAAGEAPEGITAVVFAFDRDGSFVASGQAPLEFTRLAPGDESPFQVTIPNVPGVGRYRVSFRTAAGVMRHVDKRPALQVSTN